MSNARRRALWRLVLVSIPVVAAACFGPQRPRVSTGSPVPQADTVRRAITAPARDTAMRDSAQRDSVTRDSLRALAEAMAKRAADSLANVKRAAIPTTSLAKKKPARECVLNTTRSPPETRFTFIRQNDSSSNMAIGGGFVGFCEGEKNTISADSAEHFQEAGFINLFGNVTYVETGTMKVTANHATYFTREGKMYADGNVTAVQLRTGSTFTGPSIEYFRVMPDVRTVSRLYAAQRPVVTVMQKDSLGKPLPPIVMTANAMEDRGDSVLFAWGNVDLKRTDVHGTGDSSSYDKKSERSRLVRSARIESAEKDRSFTLTGDTIDLFARERVLERVFASHRANARSGDVTLRAERIDLRLTDQRIHRAYAFGTGRSQAETRTQNLEADSIDVLLPMQRVRELHALGRAMATGVPDSTKIRSDDRDIIQGDTVIALFDSLATPGDTASRPVIRNLIAGGHASSLFQVAAKEGPGTAPSINYLRGHRIVVAFDSGQVRIVTVDSAASGLFLEPAVDSLSDSARKPPVAPPIKPPLFPTSGQKFESNPPLPLPKVPDFLPTREPLTFRRRS